MPSSAMTKDDSMVSELAPSVSYEEIESRIQEIGHQIFAGVAQSKYSSSWWYSTLMDLSTRDPRVKTQLFRFVDVLPVLQTRSQKKRELLEYLAKPQGFRGSWPFLLSAASQILRVPLVSDRVADIAERNVKQMGQVFIVGNDFASAAPRLVEARQKKNRGFTLDILGESILSNDEAEKYRQRYHQLIADLKSFESQWRANPQVDISHLGPIPKANISIKISALDCRIDPMAFEESIARLMQRIVPLLREAKAANIFVNFDMEFYDLCELTRELFKRVLFHPEFVSWRHLGIVCQAYLKDSRDQIADWILVAKKRACPFTIRLVKGAYWDFETIHADQNGWPVPVFSEKSETDANYEVCARDLLMAYPQIELAMGSHNLRSIGAALAFAESRGLPRNSLELQMLRYGGSLQRLLSQNGLPLARL